jgi:hypothetical protein
VKRVASISLWFLVMCASAAIASSLDALVAWAEHAAPQAAYAVSTETPTKVDDHFGAVPYAQWKGPRGKDGLAANGMYLPTAGAGSTWVYDPVHQIAASSFMGEETGDHILYAAPPPSTIPTRDLSHTVSAHGLKLGMSPGQAAHDLGVAITALQRVDAHHSCLSTNDITQQDGAPLGHYATIVFRDGKAVYIALGDAGP